MTKEYPLSKQEFAKKMKEKRAALYFMADQQLSLVTKNKEYYLQFITLMAKFNLNPTNTLLVQMQCPKAIMLNDVAHWKEKGYYIKKGEKGTAILQPSHSYQRSDGSVGVNFNVKYLFDITQTSCEEIIKPTYPSLQKLEYAVKHKESVIQNQTKDSSDFNSYIISLIKQCCLKEGKDLDNFLIDSVVYMFAYRYGCYVDIEFTNKSIDYFKHLETRVIKEKLKQMKTLFTTINTRIEHGLYVYEKENEYE